MTLLDDMLELQGRRAARAHFLDFVRYTKPQYEETWFNRLTCQALERVEQAIVDRRDARLMIRMPPRSGKSELGSRKFAPWFMGRHPEMDVITACYNASLAETLGGDARNLVESTRYQTLFPAVKLRKDSKAKGQWNTNFGGSFTAVGVGGGATGKGAHALIIDDPYKDSKEAWSETVRRNVWDWYGTVAYTRLAPGAAIIMILTSWHEDGLDNRVLKMQQETGERWEVIDVPAVMEEGYQGAHPADPRKPGESYWPDRWPLARLDVTRKMLGSYAWSALYQQRAASQLGAIVLREWIKNWRKVPAQFNEMVLSCDLAFKKKAESSRVAMQVWGKLNRGKEADYYFVDRITRAMEFTESLHAFDTLAKRYPKATQLVEDAANGPALQSVLQKRYPRIKMVPVDTDKIGRFRAVAPVFERGNVYLPEPQVLPWAKDVIEEYVKFPNVEHNDDVDATSQALGHWEVPADGLPRFVEWNL
jgi:predicted phage terminase large subunit-like protein